MVHQDAASNDRESVSGTDGPFSHRSISIKYDCAAWSLGIKFYEVRYGFDTDSRDSMAV